MMPSISSQRPRVIVTTSWDDDAASGMRLSRLLESAGIKGTFYVPTGQLGHPHRFSAKDLRHLNEKGFEIGAHTVSHPLLTELSKAELKIEVGECKRILEDIIGCEVGTFCYPRGRFNGRVVEEVERAGYFGARSTVMLGSAHAFPRYQMPTTIQAFPHHRLNYTRNFVRAGKVSALLKSIPDLALFESWLQLGKKLFDRALIHGGVWHLYGHPWEIEKLNLWSELEEMLAHVGGRPEVSYLTNIEVLKQIFCGDRHPVAAKSMQTRVIE